MRCPTFTLNNGTKIPVLGLGTFLFDDCKQQVKDAILKYGYRHIDTASLYGNEEAIGEALQECFAAGIKRKDLWITTKLWHDDKRNPEKALKLSLKKLKLDYVDLYLIHWMRVDIKWEGQKPKIISPPTHEVWKNMESLVKKGLTKSIGVSNCTMPMLFDLIAGCKIKPVVNQIELHPYFQQTRVNEFHHKLGVYIQSYGSIGAGQFTMREDRHKNVSVLSDPLIKRIAKAKGKSPAQIVLAWHIQRKCIPLAKTSKEERLAENISAAYSVKLSAQEVKQIDGLDSNVRLFNPKFMNALGWNGMPYFE